MSFSLAIWYARRSAMKICTLSIVSSSICASSWATHILFFIGSRCEAIPIWYLSSVRHTQPRICSNGYSSRVTPRLLASQVMSMGANMLFFYLIFLFHELHESLYLFDSIGIITELRGEGIVHVWFSLYSENLLFCFLNYFLKLFFR